MPADVHPRPLPPPPEQGTTGSLHRRNNVVSGVENAGLLWLPNAARCLRGPAMILEEGNGVD